GLGRNRLTRMGSDDVADLRKHHPGRPPARPVPGRGRARPSGRLRRGAGMTAAANAGTGDVFARVACGIDGSDASIGTVRQVAQLVPEGAEVTLFGVANEDAGVSIGWPAMPIAQATKVPRDAIEAGIVRAREVLPAHVSVQSGIVTGPPAPLSIVEAKVRNATVVAIGSHGHRRMPGILIGSVATALIHAAPCSVLLARPGTDDAAFPRSIVVGLDGSGQSREAARH